MTEFSNLALQRYLHSSFERIEKMVEKEFSILLTEGKDAEKILAYLKTIEQALHDLGVPEDPSENIQIRTGAAEWMLSHDAVLQAEYIGFRKSGWLSIVNVILENKLLKEAKD